MSLPLPLSIPPPYSYTCPLPPPSTVRSRSLFQSPLPQAPTVWSCGQQWTGEGAEKRDRPEGAEAWVWLPWLVTASSRTWHRRAQNRALSLCRLSGAWPSGTQWQDLCVSGRKIKQGSLGWWSWRFSIQVFKIKNTGRSGFSPSLYMVGLVQRPIPLLTCSHFLCFPCPTVCLCCSTILFSVSVSSSLVLGFVLFCTKR